MSLVKLSLLTAGELLPRRCTEKQPHMYPETDLNYICSPCETKVLYMSNLAFIWLLTPQVESKFASQKFLSLVDGCLRGARLHSLGFLIVSQEVTTPVACDLDKKEVRLLAFLYLKSLA